MLFHSCSVCFCFFYFMFGDLNLIHMYETHGIFLLSLFVLIMYSMCYSMTINLIWIELNWRHIQLRMSKYKKEYWIYTIHYVKPTSQLLFKSRFPKAGPTCGRQAVNPRHQTPQGQSVAKSETQITAETHTMDMLWEKFQWILPLYMKPISFQTKASVVCSVTTAVFIDFCLDKLNVFSQHIGQKT